MPRRLCDRRSLAAGLSLLGLLFAAPRHAWAQG